MTSVLLNQLYRPSSKIKINFGVTLDLQKATLKLQKEWDRNSVTKISASCRGLNKCVIKISQFLDRLSKLKLKNLQIYLIFSILKHPQDGYINLKKNEIVFKNVCGKSDSVDLEKAGDWKNVLKKMIFDREEKKMFIVDALGLFYQCVPNKTVSFKNKSCKGGNWANNK